MIINKLMSQGPSPFSGVMLFFGVRDMGIDQLRQHVFRLIQSNLTSLPESHSVETSTEVITIDKGVLTINMSIKKILRFDLESCEWISDGVLEVTQGDYLLLLSALELIYKDFKKL